MKWAGEEEEEEEETVSEDSHLDNDDFHEHATPWWDKFALDAFIKHIIVV